MQTRAKMKTFDSDLIIFQFANEQFSNKVSICEIAKLKNLLKHSLKYDFHPKQIILENEFKQFGKKKKSFCTSKNGKYFFIGEAGICDNKIIMCDSGTFKILKEFKGHESHIHDLCTTRNDRLLISGGGDHISIWNIQTGKEEKRIYYNAFCLFISSDNHWLITGSSSKTIRCYSLKNFSLVTTLDSGHSDIVNQVCLTSDNVYLITSSLDNSIKIWNFKVNLCLHTIKIHNQRITQLALSHDEISFFSSSLDGTIYVHNLLDGKVLHFIGKKKDGVRSIDLHHSGEWIACGYDYGMIKIYSVASGDCVKVIQNQFVTVNKVCWIWNKLIALFDDRSVKIWK